MNDDAQKELGDLQQQLFRPIAEKAQDVLKAYSTENGFRCRVRYLEPGEQHHLQFRTSPISPLKSSAEVDSTPTKPAAALRCSAESSRRQQEIGAGTRKHKGTNKISCAFCASVASF